MKRRDWIRNTSFAGTGLLLSRYLKASDLFEYTLERCIKDSGLWFKESLK